MIKIFFLLAVLFSFVGVAFAATTPDTINDIFIALATGNMAGFVPVLIAVGFVIFLTGVIRFLGAGDNEEKRAGGKQVITYGVVILFVMIGFWGIVRIMTQSFFAKDPTLPNYLPPIVQPN